MAGRQAAKMQAAKMQAAKMQAAKMQAAKMQAAKTILAGAKPLVVGWDDEFNSVDWQPLPVPNAPDVSMPRPGFLKLSLGKGATSPAVPAPFYWASVSRSIEVDTDRYPILAVRAVNLTGPSWWDVTVQGEGAGNQAIKAFIAGMDLGFTETVAPTAPGFFSVQTSGGLVGKEVKTPSLNHDGVMLFDLQAQESSGLALSSHRFRIRLDIAGTAAGGSVDYDWLRFVGRQDAERLLAAPRISDLVVDARTPRRGTPAAGVVSLPPPEVPPSRANGHRGMPVLSVSRDGVAYVVSHGYISAYAVDGYPLQLRKIGQVELPAAVAEPQPPFTQGRRFGY